MDDSKVFMFPNGGNTGNIDSNLLWALSQNGGFGNNNWIWILFLWLIWGNNGWGNSFGNNGGTGYLANQMSNDAGRDLILQALNGRADALGQLASITNTGVETVKNGIFALQNAINQVGTQVGMSGLQVQNAVQSGNAAISQQLCQCCCENRLAIANQTSTLLSEASSNANAAQFQLAQHDANVRLQLAEAKGDQNLAICQQTNTLQNQAERDTTSILNAIAGQNTLITKEFCDLKERELLNKINTLGDIITQLRGLISNDKQTEAFNAAFNILNDKINVLASKQPNTVPVVYPNLTAVNNTPYNGSFNPWGYNFNGGSYWG